MYLFLSSLFYLIIAVDCILKFNFIFSVVVKQFRCSCYEITSIFNDFLCYDTIAMTHCLRFTN